MRLRATEQSSYFYVWSLWPSKIYNFDVKRITICFLISEDRHALPPSKIKKKEEEEEEDLNEANFDEVQIFCPKFHSFYKNDI